jgi:DNA-binding Lrp family transcriptional regulator
MLKDKLDRIDIRILAELQRSGRITNIDLAEAVALSPSPCLQRVKRLEKAGCIVSYHAHIDLAKLGETTTIFTEITLSDHHRENFRKFEEKIADVDEVIECHLVSGGYDYLLRFLTRGINHYQAVIEDVLDRDIGIEKYFSYIVIKSPFVKHHSPLEKLFPTDREA